MIQPLADAFFGQQNFDPRYANTRKSWKEMPLAETKKEWSVKLYSPYPKDPIN